MKLYTLIFLLFLGYASAAQTYYSEYDCVSKKFTTLKDAGDAEESPAKIMLEALADKELIMQYKMEIYSNCSYAYIRVIPQKINLPGVKLSADDEEYYLVDYQKKLVYDLKKLSYSDYANPDMLPLRHDVKDTLFEEIVIRGKDSAVITFQKHLPKCLTNKIILANNAYGIKKLRTKKQLVILTKHRRADDFDFNKYIQQTKGFTKKTKPFNHLFLA